MGCLDTHVDCTCNHCNHLDESSNQPVRKKTGVMQENDKPDDIARKGTLDGNRGVGVIYIYSKYYNVLLLISRTNSVFFNLL